MKFPQTTTTSKLAVKIGAGLLLLALIAFFAGWGMISAFFSILGLSSMLAAVFLKKY